MKTALTTLLGSLPALGTLLLAQSGRAATLQPNVNYGATGAVMNVYVPDRVDASPGIVVSLHYCGGNAQAAAGWFTGLADQYGFIVIAPGLPSGDADGCWDVGSTATRTHNGGSHSRAISQMVAYAITTYRADRTRVFAAGASSGAMMTNILLGAYPDVFAAGSVLAGVPLGCWTVADGWDNSCAGGMTTKTAQQWGDLVRNGYPGYTGARPRVQLFHGTADTTLNYANLAEEVKQWTNVFGVSGTPTATQQNTPKSGWTRTSYGPNLQVSIGQGVTHDLTPQGLFPDVIHFFGLDQDATGGTGGMGGAGGMGGRGGAGAGGRGGTGGTTSGGASGGVGQGGVPTGGAGGGLSGTGGDIGVGGSVSGTGGTVGVGGVGGSSFGGSTASGGTTTGGATTGGATTGGATSGGATSTGGAATTGGASGSATGGASGSTTTAGTPGTTSDSDPEPLDDGGCGCRLPSRDERGQRPVRELFVLLAAGLAMARRRRPRA